MHISCAAVTEDTKKKKTDKFLGQKMFLYKIYEQRTIRNWEMGDLYGLVKQPWRTTKVKR
jgi:hypothetical protein